MPPERAIRPLPPLLAPLPRMPGSIEEALDLLAEGKNYDNDDIHDPRRRAAFIQIGANDGKMNDPLYKPMLTRHHRWNGLLVEPQPKLYNKLVALHEDKRERWGFYNGLVSSQCGSNGTVAFCESVKSGEGM